MRWSCRRAWQAPCGSQTQNTEEDKHLRMIQLKLLSQTCNLILVTFDCEVGNLIVVRAVGAFLHRSELFGVAHLNVDSFKAMLSHQLIYQCYLIYLRKLSGYLCHHDHHLAGWWKYWKTWTQTTGSMLRPANCRASITVMHIWIKIIGIMIWQCRW